MEKPADVCDLSTKKCVPCEGGVPALSRSEAEGLLARIPGWKLSDDGKHLLRSFTFKNFVANMAFLNKVAAAAEEEGHHPDFSVHYNRADFDIWTHAIGGVSENDFILAAKISKLAPA